MGPTTECPKPCVLQNDSLNGIFPSGSAGELAGQKAGDNCLVEPDFDHRFKVYPGDILVVVSPGLELQVTVVNQQSLADICCKT